MQQTLLLLAHLNRNPQSVLLIDEPDAHLEILRQREIYRLLTDVASERGSLIIVASHSEVGLNEAADRHVTVFHTLPRLGWVQGPLSLHNYLALVESSRSFESLGAASGAEGVLLGRGAARRGGAGDQIGIGHWFGDQIHRSRGALRR